MPAVKFLPKDFVRPISNKINNLFLLANAAQSFTVPAGYTKVYLSCNVSGVAIWVKYGATAVIPTVTTIDGSSPMVNPAGLSVSAGATLSCICSSACIVTAEFYE